MSGERRRDAHHLLLRAIAERVAGGGPAEIVSARSEAWASATFTGARHSLQLRIEGADAADRASRLTGELDAIEFTLPGHLVADIALTSRHDTAEGVALAIEALTVEDA
jgi:hypothetical protein